MDSKADQRRLTVKALGSRGLPTLKLPNQRCQAQRFEIADFLFGRALRVLVGWPLSTPNNPPSPHPFQRNRVFLLASVPVVAVARSLISIPSVCRRETWRWTDELPNLHTEARSQAAAVPVRSRRRSMEVLVSLLSRASRARRWNRPPGR